MKKDLYEFWTPNLQVNHRANCEWEAQKGFQ